MVLAQHAWRGRWVVWGTVWIALGATADAASPPTQTDPFAARPGFDVAEVDAPRGTPALPTTTARPEAWPGGDEPRVASRDERRPPAATTSPPAEESPQGQLLADAQPLARVGAEVILYGDVAAPVNQRLAQVFQGRNPTPAEVEAQRQTLVRQAVAELIERKLVVAKARREIPAEALPKVEKNVAEQFDKTQVKDMMAKSGARTRADLDNLLRQSGSSLEHEKKVFFERGMAQQWIRKDINFEPEVTHDEMLEYYHKHREEYAFVGQVRWEELVVRFDKFASKADAYRALAEMGNQVLGGKSLGEIARRGSHGISAASGGERPWTSEGSLVSDVLNDALFSLPVGQMSRILEDQSGFSIVRVLERKPSGVRSFVDTQVEIRDRIKKEKVEKETKKYIEKLRQDTPVWTVFDADKSLVSGGM